MIKNQDQPTFSLHDIKKSDKHEEKTQKNSKIKKFLYL